MHCTIGMIPYRRTAMLLVDLLLKSGGPNAPSAVPTASGNEPATSHEEMARHYAPVICQGTASDQNPLEIDHREYSDAGDGFDWIAELRARGVKVGAWTLDANKSGHVAVAQRMAEMSIDRITTNNAPSLSRALDATTVY